MIWDLLEVITSPQDYAIKVINGEFHIKPKFHVNRMKPQETTMSDSMSSETTNGQLTEELAEQILDIAEEYPRGKAKPVIVELLKEKAKIVVETIGGGTAVTPADS